MYTGDRSWLMDMTKTGDIRWALDVQQLIAKHSKPSDDPNHDQTDVKAWLKELIDKVVDGMPVVTALPYDDNMRAAAVLSQILSLWYLRVQRAKAHDPNRPIFHRREAMIRWHDYVHALMNNVLDDSCDSCIFPGQKWQSPHSPEATSGNFV